MQAEDVVGGGGRRDDAKTLGSLGGSGRTTTGASDGRSGRLCTLMGACYVPLAVKL